MRHGWVLAIVAVALAVMGCGAATSAPRRSGTSTLRTVTMVSGCLRSAHLSARPFLRGRTFFDEISPRPLALIGVGATYALYANAQGAAHAFAVMKGSFSVLQQANVLVGTPEVGLRAGALKRLELCAFGPDSHPAISPLAVYHPPSGSTVMAQSGCLACHRIGAHGSAGPGQNLSNIGSQLTREQITHALKHPTAPMPSYTGLPPKDFRALLDYLTGLHQR